MTDRKPIATYVLSNFGGVSVLDIRYGIEDEVDWRYYDIEEGTSIIEYEPDDEARAYFMVGEIKIYLDECMRV